MHDGKNSAFNDNTKLLIQVNDLISTLDFHLIKKQEGEPSRQKVEDPVVHCLQFHFSSVLLVLSIAGMRKEVKNVDTVVEAIDTVDEAIRYSCSGNRRSSRGNKYRIRGNRHSRRGN